jgi:predicted acetyltransferase
MDEFRAEGRGEAWDDSMLGSDLRRFSDLWPTSGGFDAYVRRLLAQALEETPRPQGFVPCTTLWWTEGGDFLGRLAIRHRLTPSLHERGGHIGYDIRPSARRLGHATAMLRAALPLAREVGIESALITCNYDNIASKRVIENNGGVFEDRRGEKLRFWVQTVPLGSAASS